MIAPPRAMRSACPVGCMLQIGSPRCRLSAARCQLGRNARTHARAARGVGMAQAAAARKTQQVPPARHTTYRTHVTATGFTSTDRSVGCLYVLRCTLSLPHCCPPHCCLPHIVSAALCLPHVISAALLSAARCLCRTVVRRTVVCRTLSLPHCVCRMLSLLHFCPPHVVSAALSSAACLLCCTVVRRTSSAAFRLLYVRLHFVCCTLCSERCLLHVVSCMLSAPCRLLHVAWCPLHVVCCTFVCIVSAALRLLN
jgi:hypothetical protein